MLYHTKSAALWYYFSTISDYVRDYGFSQYTKNKRFFNSRLQTFYFFYKNACFNILYFPPNVYYM